MLLTLADAVISPLSTMLIEAMTLGKPILVFFPQENHGKEFRTDEVHFADVLAIPEVNVSYKSEEFVRAVTNLYSQIGDKAISQRLRDQSKFFHVLEGPTYAERLETLLTSLNN
jgi:CDP-glycerol glycerophosphotransferase (TagB/SpsB family)